MTKEIETNITSNDEIINEVLNASQRMKKRIQMKRLAPKIAIAKKKALNRLASPEKLRDRAKKKARNTIIKKLARKSKGQMSNGEKISIEKKLVSKKGAIENMAKKLFKVVKADDIARLKNKGSSTTK